MKYSNVLILAILYSMTLGCKKDSVKPTIEDTCEKQSIEVDTEPNSLLLECIKNGSVVCRFSGEVKTIRRQKVGNEYHYWINTDARQFDGREYILNDKCEVVCGYCGFCVKGDCIDDYIDADWEIIWEK